MDTNNYGSASLTQSEKADLETRLNYNDYYAATSAPVKDFLDRPEVPDIVITLYDKVYTPVAEINDHISVTADFTRNTIDTATIVIKVTDPAAGVAMQCHDTVVPVTIQIGALRWSGRVDNYDYAMSKGIRTLTLQCMGDYAWFSKIMVWPNFLAPIQAQWPNRALFIGPAITAIKTMIAEQCFRLQSGIWEFTNNLLSGNLDPKAWFGTFLMGDGNPGNMLKHPIVVVPTNPVFDASKWVSFNARMDKISTVVEQVLKDNGLLLTADLWLPGDPQPVGLRDTLTVPTIVVDVKDRSGVVGPTGGTFLDGIVSNIVDITNSAFGDSIKPFLNPKNEYAPEGVNIAPAFGVNFVQPWVIFHDHPRGGVTDFHLYGHSPLAHTIIGGGKSPKWLNDLINATFEWIIDSISIAIGISGIPSDLLNGSFDDVLLAFQLVENFERRVKLGPYAWPEFFVQTGASAYTLDEWFALKGAMWDTRGFHAVTLSFDNGFPYTLGKDLFIGSLASFACEGMLFTEYVEKVTFTDSRDERARVECVIGDGKRHDNPIVKLQRNLVHFQEAFQIITLSSN